ncbi:MAG: hypothetical protein COA44_07700 [Arcobacter sp.]|nr:MAG: hypothetical protein COA44_07700 [Arcobacter sp.]
MRNQRLFNIGVNLVKFAWVIEIIAVLIGFLISIMVSYSVYFEIKRGDHSFGFNDFSAIFVAGLPFLLVAVVEATKIPVATAMMYAKSKGWRIMLFVGVLMLTLITFETMINGFERNFANLTLAIDERKDNVVLINQNIANIEEQIKNIDTIRLEDVENAYARKISIANKSFNTQVQQQSEHVEIQLHGVNDSYKQKINLELSRLYSKESDIYTSWDAERESVQKRLRGLLNNNLQGAGSDKEKLSLEVDALKAEMKKKLDEANFFTRSRTEKKYRQLIEKKEQRLYQVSDYATGTKALQQQTGSEEQLQEHLTLVGNGYQKRIDSIRERIDYLNKQLKGKQVSYEFLRKKYRNDLEEFTANAVRNKNDTISKAAYTKQFLYNEYATIQEQIKVFDIEVYDLKKAQTQIYYDINKLVNQNQVYRVASYISNEENAIDVPMSLVGLVALIWFASLAFISSVTGVFLAISGLYIQKCYDGDIVEEMKK